MATIGEVTNDLIAIPEHLQELVRSRILHFISQEKNVSTFIKQPRGQDAAKLVYRCGRTSKYMYMY